MEKSCVILFSKSSRRCYFCRIVFHVKSFQNTQEAKEHDKMGSHPICRTVTKIQVFLFALKVNNTTQCTIARQLRFCKYFNLYLSNRVRFVLKQAYNSVTPSDREVSTPTKQIQCQSCKE